MATIEKGKSIMSSTQDSLTVNFTETFVVPPAVNISCNDNINIYLDEITNNYFICKKNSNTSGNIEINYVAVEITS